jgi:hypothetical protein
MANQVIKDRWTSYNVNGPIDRIFFSFFSFFFFFFLRFFFFIDSWEILSSTSVVYSPSCACYSRLLSTTFLKAMSSWKHHTSLKLTNGYHEKNVGHVTQYAHNAIISCTIETIDISVASTNIFVLINMILSWMWRLNMSMHYVIVYMKRTTRQHLSKQNQHDRFDRNTTYWTDSIRSKRSSSFDNWICQ